MSANDSIRPPAAAPADSVIESRIREAMQRIVDPELHCNIADLGLVYGVDSRAGVVTIRLTLTSPGCPYGPFLMHAVRTSVAEIPGVTDVKLDLVWEPPWSPALMSEAARLELGFDV